MIQREARSFASTYAPHCPGRRDARPPAPCRPRLPLARTAGGRTAAATAGLLGTVLAAGARFRLS